MHRKGITLVFSRRAKDQALDPRKYVVCLFPLLCGACCSCPRSITSGLLLLEPELATLFLVWFLSPCLGVTWWFYTAPCRYSVWVRPGKHHWRNEMKTVADQWCSVCEPPTVQLLQTFFPCLLRAYCKKATCLRKRILICIHTYFKLKLQLKEGDFWEISKAVGLCRFGVYFCCCFKSLSPLPDFVVVVKQEVFCFCEVCWFGVSFSFPFLLLGKDPQTG